MLRQKSCYTITFGDQAENHKGMQKIGKLAKSGFTKEELLKIMHEFEKMDLVCELIDLNALLPANITADPAYLLVIRGGSKVFLGEEHTIDDLLKEQSELDYDTKAFMYGRVVNKKARHNICFSDEGQEADYDNKMGSIIAFKDVPLLNKIRNGLPEFCGKKAELLQAEGNFYYDINKCYISYHGDAERKIVIALRLGSSIPLWYQWFQNSSAVGETLKLELNHGDMYIMSDKAVGYDWKKRKIATLRHAAGLAHLISFKK